MTSWSTVRLPATAQGHALVLIVIIGLAVRLVHLWALVDTAWPKHHLVNTETDDYAFYQWAQTILAGDWLGRNTYHPYFEWMKEIAPIETWYRWWGGKEVFHQAPLYPYFLAFSQAACRAAVECVFVFQLLIGTLHPLIIYAVARYLFDAGTGLIAATLTALYGPFVFYQGLLTRDWLPPILEPLAILALIRAQNSNRRAHWVLAGGAFGLAILCRETAVLVTSAAILWVVLRPYGAISLRFRNTGWLAMGLLLCLLPLGIRNGLVGAPLLSISNRGAEAFVMANASTESISALSRDVHDVLSGLQHMLAHDPSQFLIRMGWKVRILIDRFEYPNNVSFYYGVDISSILQWLPDYGLMFPLAMTGLCLGAGGNRARQLWLIYGAATISWLLVFSPMSRYRLALMPFLIPYGAYLLTHVADRLRHHQWRPLGVSLLVLMAFVCLQQVLLALPSSQKDYAYLPDYSASANAYALEQRFDRAESELTRWIDRVIETSSPRRIPPSVVIDRLVYQGKRLLQEGNKAQALDRVEEARFLASSPVNMANREMHYLWYNFGVFYLQLGERDKAEKALNRFIEFDPHHPEARRAKHLLSSLQASH